MFDTTDPELFWLNMMNYALGLLTLTALVALCWAILRDVRERIQREVTAAAPAATHSFHHPGLGLTMADGGEPMEAGSIDGKRKQRS